MPHSLLLSPLPPPVALVCTGPYEYQPKPSKHRFSFDGPMVPMPPMPDRVSVGKKLWVMITKSCSLETCRAAEVSAGKRTAKLEKTLGHED